MSYAPRSRRGRPANAVLQPDDIKRARELAAIGKPVWEIRLEMGLRCADETLRLAIKGKTYRGV